ncbi:MAG TPA: Ig-like domain-containing protein [Vicinamibacterales bacterium]|nr:Ig-like domain-containing protein [Vicinamibacterales bacterium]
MQTLKYSALVVVVALLAACDKVPLLAPTGSAITLSANSVVVPTNGTTGLTAFVTESSGTPVQNGTTVRFTTTLGTVSPAETQTTNGVAVATFQAGGSSGVAEVHAISGGATGSSTGGGTGTTTTTNTVKITVGAAAVNTVTLRANPSSVGPSGGAVELVASVVTESGAPVQNVPVTFNADQGTLTVQTVPTDANGEARTVLTTAQKTTVTATAGTKTSAAVTVDSRVGPGISITCAPGSGTGTNCSNLQASSSSNTASVVFTVSKGSGTSNLRDVTIDFGDGSTQSLGTLAGGSATIAHSYAGPSGSSPRSYTATVRATDVNNETTTASSNVTITPRGPMTVDLTVSPGDGTRPVTETFTATVTGGDAQSFAWDFENDGNIDATTTTNKTTHVYGTNASAGPTTATVTVTTTDGRNGNGRVEFNLR